MALYPKEGKISMYCLPQVREICLFYLYSLGGHPLVNNLDMFFSDVNAWIKYGNFAPLIYFHDGFCEFIRAPNDKNTGVGKW
jgi:hypothetical protein